MNLRKEPYQAIFFSNSKFRYIDEFFNTKEELYYSAVNQSISEEKLGTLITQVEKDILGNTNIVDLRASSEIRDDVNNFSTLLRLRGFDTKMQLGFCKDGVYQVIIKSNRSNCMVLSNVRQSDETCTYFDIKDRFRIYNSEAFSIAFKCANFWISFEIGGGTGIKGKAQAIVKLMKGNTLVIDDLSKYIDVTQLLEGMSP